MEQHRGVVGLAVPLEVVPHGLEFLGLEFPLVVVGIVALGLHVDHEARRGDIHLLLYDPHVHARVAGARGGVFGGAHADLDLRRDLVKPGGQALLLLLAIRLAEDR